MAAFMETPKEQVGSAKRRAWLMALQVLDLKLRVAKFRSIGYDLRMTMQRSY